MRQLTANELEQIKILSENSVDFSLLEITATGKDKSTMDATGSFREFLRQHAIHDYNIQMQGPNHKVFVKSFIFSENNFVESDASLYRPITKNGDPRIWFTGLRKCVSANDILAIVAHEEKLFVLNVTNIDIQALISPLASNALKDLINEINKDANEISSELLAKLRIISAMGYVPALLQADTSIGRTLEHLLGINMNSSRSPDYKGIELKSARDHKTTRKGLFAKTPNWELSKFKSRKEILDHFGYWEKGVFRLYNTIRGTGRNAQGLILKTDYNLGYLIENSDNPAIGDFLVWELEELKKSLIAKHKETFWINAEHKKVDGKEYFLYSSVKHTKNPLVNQFGLLVEIGAITLDYPIKQLENGSIIDKGCNFKIKQNALDLLFPPSQTYSLL